MQKYDDKKEGWLVYSWERIFYFLGKISLFTVVRKLFKNKTHHFVDFWILANTLFAIVASIIVYCVDIRYTPIFYVLTIYGVMRVFEIIVYQINVLLFDAYRSEKDGKKYKVKSIRRILIAIFHNFVEIIFWYSVITITVVKLTTGISQSWLEFVTSSILCMTTFDRGMLEGVVDSKVVILSTIATCEVMSGLMMTLVCLARFIGILPKVEEMRDEEDKIGCICGQKMCEYESKKMSKAESEEIRN